MSMTSKNTPTEQGRRLLIAGIPGTGKTTIGDEMKNAGFVHWDVEKTRQVPDLQSETRSIVVTWGFQPEDNSSVAAVRTLMGQGAELVWFDGNRDAALREFKKRGDVPEELFHLQVARLERTQIVSQLKPRIVNTFDAAGKFRRKSAIVKEILE